MAALGAVFSLRAGRLDFAAGIILLGFTLALIAELAGWARKPEEQWYDGRALAESAKTLAWRYAVGAEPFRVTLDSSQAQAILRERLAKIGEEASDRITITSPGPLVTSGMQDLRDSDFKARRSAYVKGRTEEQQQWYAKKAEANRKRAAGWRIALIGAEVIALVLAALRVFGGVGRRPRGSDGGDHRGGWSVGGREAVLAARSSLLHSRDGTHDSGRQVTDGH